VSDPIVVRDLRKVFRVHERQERLAAAVHGEPAGDLPELHRGGPLPVDIYPGWLRVTLSTVVPIGIAVTVPAQAVAGKVDALGVGAIVAAAILALAFSAWFWTRGLRSYTGASA
jgi:ABC-type uncharacterized transport system permease subunit